MNNEWFLVSFEHVEVYIAESVYQQWQTYKQDAPTDLEACGVIIGSKQQDKNTYWIESITEPKKKDKRSIFSFILKDPFHQKYVDKQYQHSNGSSVYLGTWHTHPQEIPNPSSVDYDDWRSCIKRNADRHLFFIIVGTNRVKIFTWNGSNFQGKQVTFGTNE